MTDEERSAECDRFLDRWPASEFGPAHIVVSDENFGDGHIVWCQGILHAIRYARKEQRGRDPIELYKNLSDAELEATDRLLSYLLTGQHPARVVGDTQNGMNVELLRWTDVEEPLETPP